ncbi:MAG: PAS domain S-box protein [Chitinophagaceae bacterium]|nr:PAS domain S-box protein [Chitinophagaceae bacterium]
MISSANITLQKKLHTWSFWLIAVICIISVLGFTAWLTGKMPQRGDDASAFTIYPLVSFYLLLISSALYLLSLPQKQYTVTGYIIAGFVLIAVCYKLGAVFFKWNDFTDKFLLKKVNITFPESFTHISPAVLVAFLLAALGLLLQPVLQNRSMIFVRTAAVALLVWCLLILPGNVYGIESSYMLAFLMPETALTILLFMLLAVSLFFFNTGALLDGAVEGRVSAGTFIRVLVIVLSLLAFAVLTGYANPGYGFIYFFISVISMLAAVLVYHSSFTNRQGGQIPGGEVPVSHTLQLQTFNASLENEVREKTRELTDIFERVTDGFAALDKNCLFTYVNRRACQMFQREQEDLLGKCVWDIFPEAVGSATYCALHNAMHTQKHMQSVDMYGVLGLWLEYNIYPSVNGVSVFFKDITIQKKKDKEVAEARALADKLIDSLPGVFYFYDINGKFIRWNRQLEEVTGYSADEIAHMHPTRFFPADEKEDISDMITAVFEKGWGDAEADFLSKTGLRSSYYFKAVLIEYNGNPCMLGSGIDITERKKAEERVRQSEQKYKLLFEKNPQPMWIFDMLKSKVIDVNNACLQQYGYTRGEFLSLDINDLLFPQELSRMQAEVDANFRELYHTGVWRHQNKEGNLIYADIIVHDIYYQGMPARLVLATNVTEQYLAEEKLKRSYDEIRELTEYLQKVREEERMRISREIHDELGQLLTVLKIDISWISKRVPGNDIQVKKKISEALDMVDITVKTVRRIASELRPALLDDLGLRAAMLWHIREFENRSGVRTEAELTSEELFLSDERKTGLYRILQESLTNVARHAESKKVCIAMDVKDAGLTLTISDDGKGFDPAKREQKTLGLLGMKERAQGMGGAYSIYSKPGEGTTVTVVLPITGEDMHGILR